MSETQERMNAARHLIPEIESMIRFCGGLPSLQGNAAINAAARVNQTIQKCTPIIHIISIGNTQPRASLASQWKLFLEEWPLKRYKIAAGLLEHCLRYLQAISQGG